jgi:hypothetical protein
MTLQLRTNSALMHEVYDRIVSGIFHDKNLKIYKREFLLKVLDYFEKNEDYEKCQHLLKIFNKRFDHDQNFKIPYYELR